MVVVVVVMMWSYNIWLLYFFCTYIQTFRDFAIKLHDTIPSGGTFSNLSFHCNLVCETDALHVLY
jgi:hypothetical protein